MDQESNQRSMADRWMKQQENAEVTPDTDVKTNLYTNLAPSRERFETLEGGPAQTDTHMFGMVSVTYSGIVVNPIYSTTSNSNPEVTPYGSSISGHEDSGLAARIRHLGMLNSPTQPRSIWAVSAYKTKIITNTHFSTSKVGYGDVSINNTAKHH